MPDLIPWWQGLPQGQAATQPLDPTQLISAQAMAEKLKTQQQVTQGYNALGRLYANPANLDANGNLKPEALSTLMSVAPAVGLDVKNSQIETAARQAQLGQAVAKVRDEHHDWLISTVAAPAVAKYDEILKSTGSAQQAQTAAQEVYSEGLQSAKQDGRLTSQEVGALAPNFDYNRARTNVQGRQGLAEQEKQAQHFTLQTDYGKNPPVQYKLFDDQHTTDMAGSPYVPTGIGAPAKTESTIYHAQTVDGKQIDMVMGPTGGWINAANQQAIPKDQIKPGTITSGTHSKTPQQQAVDMYMQEHPDATSQDIAKFMESMHPARSGAAAAVRKYMEENPNASSADIASFNAWQRETSAGAQAFGTGPQGNSTRAQNVAIDHLGFLSGDLVPALQNGDVRALNSVKNWAKTEFGYEGPVDFNFAKGIVSQEVNKAIVNVGAGTELERANLQSMLSAANSPEQLAGVIASAKRLMAGQLRSLEQQYIDVTVPASERGDPKAVERARESFQQKLFPRTLQELSVGGDHPSGATGAAGAAPKAAVPQGEPPPPEVASKLKEGVETTFGNGTVWTLRDGKPVQVK